MTSKTAYILGQSTAGRSLDFPAAFPSRKKAMPFFLFFLLFIVWAACPCTAAAKQVTICVLDSGCNLNRTEGWSFLADTADITDLSGHGTKICSLLASCAPDAKIIMLKCFESEESFDGKAAINALYAAVDQFGADIISMSWTASQESDDLHEAVRYAAEKGAILVAPAGNISLSTGLGATVYPAAWNEVIGIGGVNLDSNGEPAASLWYLSGKAVYVCANAEYDGEKGSSFAVPRVAAAIAAHLAQSPYKTADSIRQMLREAAQDFGEPGYDTIFGWGYIVNKN